MPCSAAALVISTTVHHRIQTATVRDDMVGWVMSGRKRLIRPQGGMDFRQGEVFVIPRATHWEIVNDPAPQGRYVARILTFSPALVALFHQRFGQFAAHPALQGCANLNPPTQFTDTLSRAASILEDATASPALQQHRTLEVLLLLAENGLVFAPAHELGWADRVRRLVGQRPQAAWALDEMAKAFNLSTSTLQRRLAEEGASASQCLREVRLETALTLLQSTALQVSDIAARCGYESHSRFSAAFRERFGFTPSQLRP
jgi:AraC-like DNA-binding protein